MKNVGYYCMLFSCWCTFLHPRNSQGFSVTPLRVDRSASHVRRKLAGCHDEHEQLDQKDSFSSQCPMGLIVERRQAILLSLMGACFSMPITSASAKTTTITTSSTVKQSSNTFVAPVTKKVFMNVRISRSDGTFYVRDEQDGDPDDQVLYARLVIGLFGTVAPVHVQQFLSYFPQTTTAANDNDSADFDDLISLPSYAQSTFPSLDQATGLLNAGFIPALQVTEINGASALQYGGRLLPASLWLESSSSSSPSSTTTTRVSHAAAARGLVTHRQLDVTPAFQITTRAPDAETARMLDATHVVFGQVVTWDTADPSALAFFRRLNEIPTYSASRRSTTTQTVESNLQEESPVDAVASSLYQVQRDFFRGAAQTLGDQRVGKIYDGKFLRRVEVTQVGVLGA